MTGTSASLDVWIVAARLSSQTCTMKTRAATLLRLNNNNKGLELQHPMLEVGGWQNKDGIVLECVGGQRLTE